MILMDRSIPPEQPTIAARHIAIAAVEAMGPQDVAAVLSTSGGVPQNLTANRDRLMAAISRRDWSTGPTPEQEAIIGKDDPLSDGRCLCGVCVLDTVTRIANALQHAPRRRKILLFIGGSAIFQAGPRAPTADVGCGRHLRDARAAMMEAIALSSLMVHALDPSGIVNIGGQTRAGVPNGPAGLPPDARRKQFLSDTGNHLLEQGSLSVLPDLTGGRVVRNTNAPQEMVPDIFDETDSYYLLAFEPRRIGAADNTRTIEVKVARPGVQVHTRRRHRLEPDATDAEVVAPRARFRSVAGNRRCASRPATRRQPAPDALARGVRRPTIGEGACAPQPGCRRVCAA